ncbi:MAG: dienelactone hydrolase family protein [Acidimicrobiales bacterium]
MITRLVLENGTPVQIAGEPTAARAIIVVQEAFGVNDHIRDVAERFAAQGYYAVAPEFFHRSGSPEVAYDDFPAAMAPMGELNKEGLTDDLLGTSAFLVEAGYPASATAVVGYCMGGTVAFYASTLGIVGAAASFYGGGVETGRFGLAPLLELASELKSAWIGLYGDLDKGIPVEQVEALRRAVAATSYPTEVHRYADAEHGFSCDARVAVYNEAAAKDATAQTLRFFNENLGVK